MGNGLCENPKFCKRKYEKWKKNQEIFIPIGELEHELYKNYMEKNEFIMNKTIHAKKRQFERAISERDITEVTYYGWVIERNYNPNTQIVNVVIMGYTSEQRPIHIVFEIESENSWNVVTVYTPLNEAHKWKKGYTERICFCS